MAWPHPPDYNEAIQNPQFCFSDPELRLGQPAMNALGLPWPRSGNTADVYKITCPNNKAWAVKCFTREVHGLRQRYQAISEHLQQNHRPFMVRFQYLEQGIRIHGQWYPLLKMRWVEGLRLNELIEEHIERPSVLERLAEMWVRLAAEMRGTQVTHGDLQHGNVLLVPRKKSSALRLRLVDYDGMFVPALAASQSGEVGHPNYQHPERLREGTYDAEMDRFAHLVIYTTLRCLIVGGRPLWQRYDNAENLLFREQDFAAPEQSALFRELLAINDPSVQALVQVLHDAARGPLDRVPLLEELVASGHIPAPIVSKQQQEAEAEPDDDPPVAEVIEEGAGSMATAVLAGKKTAKDTVILTAPVTVEVRRLETQTQSAAVAPVARSLPAFLKSRRTLWTAGVCLGMVGIALLAALAVRVAGLALGQGGDAREDPPLPRLPRLLATAAVTIKGGAQGKVKVLLDRQGYTGAVALQLDDLPEGVTARPVTLAAGENVAILELRADFDAPEGMQKAEVSAWAEGRKTGAQPVVVTVEKPALPRLASVPDIVLKPGETRVIKIDVDRQGHQGAIHLMVSGLPEGVTHANVPGSFDPDVAGLQLTAPPDTPGAKTQVQVWARVGDYLTTEKRSLNLTVEKAKIPRLLRIPDLVLTAGKKEMLRIELDRQGYEGLIELRLEGLPEGVKCDTMPLLVPADRNTISVELSAAPNSTEAEKYIDILASIGGRKCDKHVITLTLRKPPPLPAKVSPREGVTFTTFDGVRLVGTWYPSKKGRDAPIALLLHDLAPKAGSAGWDRLAQKLQEQDYAVLSFDFRGYGASTAVEANFWQYQTNKSMVRGFTAGRPKPTIAQPEFHPNYYTTLVNDIAAAKMYLDRRNDAEGGNSANLTLIGAGEGATLGALWLNSEWYRHEVVNVALRKFSPTPEGKDVTGAVWLSLAPKIGARPAAYLEWIRRSGRDKSVPMAFLHGADDAAVIAGKCMQELQPEKNGLKLTMAKAVTGAQLAGQQLLADGLETEDVILTFLARVRKDQFPVKWTERKVDDKGYFWDIPGVTPPVRAKWEGERTQRLIPLPQLGVH